MDVYLLVSVANENRVQHFALWSMNHTSAYFLIKEMLNTDAPSANDTPSVNVTSFNRASIAAGELHFKDMVEVSDFSECIHNNELIFFSTPNCF